MGNPPEKNMEHEMEIRMQRFIGVGVSKIRDPCFGDPKNKEYSSIQGPPVYGSYYISLFKH